MGKIVVTKDEKTEIEKEENIYSNIRESVGDDYVDINTAHKEPV